MWYNLSALPLPLHILCFHLIIQGGCCTIFFLSTPPKNNFSTRHPWVRNPECHVLGETPVPLAPSQACPLRATTVSEYALKSSKTAGLVVYSSSKTRHLFWRLGDLNLLVHCLLDGVPFVTSYPAPPNFPLQSAGHCRSPTICYSYLDSTIDWRAALRTSWLAILLEIEIVLQRHPQNLLFDLRHPAP